MPNEGSGVIWPWVTSCSSNRRTACSRSSRLAPDGPQRVDLAEDIFAALAANPAAGAFFDALRQFYRKAYLRWIDATTRRWPPARNPDPVRTESPDLDRASRLLNPGSGERADRRLRALPPRLGGLIRSGAVTAACSLSMSSEACALERSSGTPPRLRVRECAGRTLVARPSVRRRPSIGPSARADSRRAARGSQEGVQRRNRVLEATMQDPCGRLPAPDSYAGSAAPSIAGFSGHPTRFHASGRRARQGRLLCTTRSRPRIRFWSAVC